LASPVWLCEASLSSRRRNASSVTVGQERRSMVRCSSSAHPRVGHRQTLTDSLNGLRPLALPLDAGTASSRTADVDEPTVATVNERYRDWRSVHRV
jgi:hypothetical protein